MKLLAIRHYCIRLAATFGLLYSAFASQGVEEWRTELEQSSGEPLIVARLTPDSAGAAAALGLPHGEVLARFMADPSFLEQLSHAHALTVNYAGPEPPAHFIVLNLAREDEWGGVEDGLAGHELGHIWLDLQGFRSPPFQPGPRACIAVHAGDIVQHVLIRAEMRRRGIDAVPYWLRNLKATAASFEEPPVELTPCQRLVLLNQWLDFRFSFRPEDWDGYAAFEERFAARYPEIVRIGTEIEGAIRRINIATLPGYAYAVGLVRSRLSMLFEEASKSSQGSGV